MANTLYDENFGGKYGNTHIALGKAYHEACTCDARNMKKSDYRRLGYNESIEHTDIIATSNRRVEAHLRNGTKRLLYENGTFRV